MPPKPTIIDRFNGGEISPRMMGRVASDPYRSGMDTAENVLLWPQGPFSRRPGTRFVADLTTSTHSRLLPFIKNDTEAIALVMGSAGFKAYQNLAGTYTLLQNYSAAHGIANADFDDVHIAQDQDILYITHKTIRPSRLSRVSDDDWHFKNMVFRPPPLEANYHTRNDVGAGTRGTLTLDAATGAFTKITFDALKNTVQGTGEIIYGSFIKAGSGLGQIMPYPFISYTGASVSFYPYYMRILRPFDKTTYEYGEWAYHTVPDAGIQLELSGDNIDGGYVFVRGDLSTAYERWCPGVEWVESAATPGEYYYGDATASVAIAEPSDVREGGENMVAGAVGALAAGEWDYANNDGLVNDTIYMKPSADALTTPDGGDEFYMLFAYDFTPTVGLPFYLGNGTEAPDWEDSTDPYYLEINDGILVIEEAPNSGIALPPGGYEQARYFKCRVLELLTNLDTGSDWRIMRSIFKSDTGYPNTVAFDEGDRLVLAGAGAMPMGVHASKTAEYDNFFAGASDDDAFTSKLLSRERNEIKWIMSSNEGLMIGTSHNEWIMQAVGGVLTPSDRSADTKTNYGSGPKQPVVADGSTLFLQKLQKKLRELNKDFAVDGYISPDKTLLAEHITGDGITAMTYQAQPIPTIEAVRDDGQLLAFVFDKATKQEGWSRHIIGGSFGGGDAEVISALALPHPTDGYDELWMIVKRTIDGNTKTYLEVMTEIVDSEDHKDYWNVDSGVTFGPVAATSTITGLSHLEGEEVYVIDLTTGGIVGTYTVDGGEVDLGAKTVTEALVGLNYESKVKLPRYVTGTPALAQAQPKRISRVSVRFHRTINAKVGHGFEDDELTAIDFRSVEDPTASPTPLFTGDKLVSIPGGYSKEGYITIVQDTPMPMTVLALMPETEVKSGSSG
ncbi:MAG: hypothetical protein KAR06_01250 [Deltaproteobacteria bacterium]|nr:hypothetical protein [Deltaproteobacteria bacterium]